MTKYRISEDSKITARPVVAEIPDKRIEPLMQYFSKARVYIAALVPGLTYDDVDSDLLIAALVRSWTEAN